MMIIALNVLMMKGEKGERRKKFIIRSCSTEKKHENGFIPLSMHFYSFLFIMLLIPTP
jgi:hypothetical protein